MGDDEVGAETVGGDTTDTDTTGGDGDILEDHRSYFIGESTKFDGGGSCNNVDLNGVTSTFKNELVDAGWTGLRFVDENSWPEDFRESTFSPVALDGVYGDASRLAVYAGHGNVGSLQWGQPSDNGLCTTTISTNSRFGTFAGDTAAAVMLMTSCTLRADQLWAVFRRQEARQIFGYHNSPYIGYDEARKVFKRTQDGQATSDAWLEEMVLNSSGSNSPVVFTKGTTGEEAASIHGATNLASGEGFLENVAEPADNYYFEFYNSGCTVKCGGCVNGMAAPPEITLGAIVPRVKLARPQRTGSNLVQLATVILERFDVDVLEDETRARLEAWAGEIVANGDVHYATILEEPRLDISYDPKSDLLRVTNRQALADARPEPSQVIDDPPDLEAALQLEAEVVLGEFQVVPGALDLLGTQFEVTTREVGFGSGENSTESIAFEYMFSLPGSFEGFAMPDRSLGIGVTRLGELSTITVSMIDVEVVGESRFVRHPQQAIDALIADVLGQYPSALGVEVVEPLVGYTLAEAQESGESVPSLLLGHVIEFGSDEGSFVSRRLPVRISLTEPEATIESLEAQDPNPQEGETRAN